MGRRYDIEWSFRQAIRIADNGKKTVTTGDFVRELAKHNWDWTPRQANLWIEASISTFRDISSDDGEQRTFMLYNPNGGL